MSGNSYGARKSLSVGSDQYDIFRLDALPAAQESLPYSLKVLLENLARFEDGVAVTGDDVAALANWDAAAEPDREISYTPARVLMQDFTGVPAVVDLAAMRDAMAEMGGDPQKINPLVPVDLVIDHSIQVDVSARPDAFDLNAALEYQRNAERYGFLRWGQQAFRNFSVVPPNTGICHQVNTEFLSRTVLSRDGLAFPDTCVGTDSHTPMVNGLGVVAWGVGGIEAEAAMLGQPIPLLIPRVVGVELRGALPEGTTATDLVLTVTETLRKHGVVGKFVEFYGPGVASVPVENRATIGNMSPEYGSTITIFPIDDETLRYLRFTGRPEASVALVEAYAKTQGLWHDPARTPRFSEHLVLDLSTIEPSLAGPARPQDRVPLSKVKTATRKVMDGMNLVGDSASVHLPTGEDVELKHGAVVIAAITSCTNTSNPSVMLGAALVAKKAVEAGLTRKPWVKPSLAPGSQVVREYYERAGLMPYLSKLGFDIVGYGCTTCIGNSGPLPSEISSAVSEHGIAVAAVLSGNRNFEGRVNPDTRLNYLASPPLVVAYALAGTMDWDPATEPLGTRADGSEVFLKDIWPTAQEVADTVREAVGADLFATTYASVFEGDARWKAVPAGTGDRFAWDDNSTYIARPTFLQGIPAEPAATADIVGARVLAILGDSVTTDHISPAGNIKASSPAGEYLQSRGVAPADFNQYGARRGHHEVMIRGTLANIRIKNRMLDGVEGGLTKGPDGVQTTIYDAAMAYATTNTPLVILAGKEYGSGSSRDWAAKGTAMLGIKAVIAESYERIHRSNLIGMGVLPLQFKSGENAATLGLIGTESLTIEGIAAAGKAGSAFPKELVVVAGDVRFSVAVRVDTPTEATYYRHGGVLPYVLRSLRDK